MPVLLDWKSLMPIMIMRSGLLELLVWKGSPKGAGVALNALRLGYCVRPYMPAKGESGSLPRLWHLPAGNPLTRSIRPDNGRWRKLMQRRHPTRASVSGRNAPAGLSVLTDWGLDRVPISVRFLHPGASAPCRPRQRDFL